MLNKIMTIGRIGQQPEVRYIEGDSQDARKTARFSVACDERFKDRNGEMKEATEWINVVAWGKQADFVENYVKQGALVYVEGKLRSRSYTDKAGQKRYVTEVVADSIQLLGSKERSEERQEAKRPARPAFVPEPRPVQKPAPKPVIDDYPEDTDNLPF